MCRFCDNLRKQKEKKHEAGMVYKYRAELLTHAIKHGNHHSYSREGGMYELNYCPECGKKISQLRACPFCGQDVAKVEEDPYKVYVVCNYHEGGCGATSGYHHSKEEAIEAWNRRAGE